MEVLVLIMIHTAMVTLIVAELYRKMVKVAEVHLVLRSCSDRFSSLGSNILDHDSTSTGTTL